MAQLGDLLAGAAGAPVNRPALDAYITQGQAQAGLRTAQTEEALGRAQQMRDEQGARERVITALTNEKDLQGNPVRSPSEATALGETMRAHYGNYEQVEMAHKAALASRNVETISNPNADPAARVAAMQGNSPGVNEFQNVNGQIANRGNPGAPGVSQTGVSQSVIDKNESDALLMRLKAEHPEAFKNGNIDPAMVPLLIQYARENPDKAPGGRALTTPVGAAIATGLVSNAPGAPGQPGAQPTPNGLTPAPGVGLKEQADIRHDFANGTAAKQTTSLNTMYLHSLLFDQIADQLGNGQFTPTNRINVLWQRVFGGEAPADLRTAGSFLGREAVRATVNSGSGTGEERELHVEDNASPESMHGVARTLRSLASGQLRSLTRRAMRGGVDITQLLDPEVIQGYGLTAGHAPSLGGAGPPAAASAAPNAPAAPNAAPGAGAASADPMAQLRALAEAEHQQRLKKAAAGAQ